jgi:Histidine-specific methyltransferase, SAM-dependent/Predicted nucleotide-binding protein containing TIR-like domain
VNGRSTNGRKPRIFVGSSSEAERLIRGLSLNFGRQVNVENWATMRWAHSRSTLDGLESMFDTVDFAAFILAPDDVVTIRGKEQRVVRDNVIFELGFSFGQLGRDRTFILAPGQDFADLRQPSDLFGVNPILYDADPKPRDAMRAAAADILETVEELGPRNIPVAEATLEPGDGVLDRGDTRELQRVADAAVQVFESRHSYTSRLEELLEDKQRIPAKFQFAQPDGGRHWLKLCNSTTYTYFDRARKQLDANKARLAEKVRTAAGTGAVDLVSLGSGDGSKDDILLRALDAELSDREYTYYYPIDISDSLLVEAVRFVAVHGPNRSRFRCKPVLGDFTDLRSLRGITDHRPNVNLFSVLGNTIGTFDESEVLASIRNGMLPGDLLLLEANIGEPQESISMLKGQEAHQWDLSTLAVIGIDRESCKLSQERADEESGVPNTRTLVSYAEHNSDKYMLSALHHYDFDSLKKYLARELRVDWVDEIPEHGVGLLLGRRLR